MELTMLIKFCIILNFVNVTSRVFNSLYVFPCIRTNIPSISFLKRQVNPKKLFLKKDNKAKQFVNVNNQEYLVYPVNVSHVKHKEFTEKNTEEGSKESITDPGASELNVSYENAEKRLSFFRKRKANKFNHKHKSKHKNPDSMSNASISKIDSKHLSRSTIDDSSEANTSYNSAQTLIKTRKKFSMARKRNPGKIIDSSKNQINKKPVWKISSTTIEAHPDDLQLPKNLRTRTYMFKEPEIYYISTNENNDGTELAQSYSNSKSEQNDTSPEFENVQNQILIVDNQSTTSFKHHKTETISEFKSEHEKRTKKRPFKFMKVIKVFLLGSKSGKNNSTNKMKVQYVQDKHEEKSIKNQYEQISEKSAGATETKNIQYEEILEKAKNKVKIKSKKKCRAEKNKVVYKLQNVSQELPEMAEQEESSFKDAANTIKGKVTEMQWKHGGISKKISLNTTKIKDQEHCMVILPEPKYIVKPLGKSSITTTNQQVTYETIQQNLNLEEERTFNNTQRSSKISVTEQNSNKMTAVGKFIPLIQSLINCRQRQPLQVSTKIDNINEPHLNTQYDFEISENLKSENIQSTLTLQMISSEEFEPVVRTKYHTINEATQLQSIITLQDKSTSTIKKHDMASQLSNSYSTKKIQTQRSEQFDKLDNIPSSEALRPGNEGNKPKSSVQVLMGYKTTADPKELISGNSDEICLSTEKQLKSELSVEVLHLTSSVTFEPSLRYLTEGSNRNYNSGITEAFCKSAGLEQNNVGVPKSKIECFELNSCKESEEDLLYTQKKHKKTHRALGYSYYCEADCTLSKNKYKQEVCSLDEEEEHSIHNSLCPYKNKTLSNQITQPLVNLNKASEVLIQESITSIESETKVREEKNFLFNQSVNSDTKIKNKSLSNSTTTPVARDSKFSKKLSKINQKYPKSKINYDCPKIVKEDSTVTVIYANKKSVSSKKKDNVTYYLNRAKCGSKSQAEEKETQLDNVLASNTAQDDYQQHYKTTTKNLKSNPSFKILHLRSLKFSSQSGTEQSDTELKQIHNIFIEDFYKVPKSKQNFHGEESTKLIRKELSISTVESNDSLGLLEWESYLGLTSTKQLQCESENLSEDMIINNPLRLSQSNLKHTDSKLSISINTSEESIVSESDLDFAKISHKKPFGTKDKHKNLSQIYPVVSTNKFSPQLLDHFGRESDVRTHPLTVQGFDIEVTPSTAYKNSKKIFANNKTVQAIHEVRHNLIDYNNQSRKDNRNQKDKTIESHPTIRQSKKIKVWKEKKPLKSIESLCSDHSMVHFFTKTFPFEDLHEDRYKSYEHTKKPLLPELKVATNEYGRKRLTIDLDLENLDILEPLKQIKLFQYGDLLKTPNQSLKTKVQESFHRNKYDNNDGFPWLNSPKVSFVDNLVTGLHQTFEIRPALEKSKGPFKKKPPQKRENLRDYVFESFLRPMTSDHTIIKIPKTHPLSEMKTTSPTGKRYWDPEPVLKELHFHKPKDESQPVGGAVTPKQYELEKKLQELLAKCNMIYEIIIPFTMIDKRLQAKMLAEQEKRLLQLIEEGGCTCPTEDEEEVEAMKSQIIGTKDQSTTPERGTGYSVENLSNKCKKESLKDVKSTKETDYSKYYYQECPSPLRSHKISKASVVSLKDDTVESYRRKRDISKTQVAQSLSHVCIGSKEHSDKAYVVSARDSVVSVESGTKPKKEKCFSRAASCQSLVGTDTKIKKRPLPSSSTAPGKKECQLTNFIPQIKPKQPKSKVGYPRSEIAERGSTAIIYADRKSIPTKKKKSTVDSSQTESEFEFNRDDRKTPEPKIKNGRKEVREDERRVARRYETPDRADEKQMPKSYGKKHETIDKIKDERQVPRGYERPVKSAPVGQQHEKCLEFCKSYQSCSSRAPSKPLNKPARNSLDGSPDISTADIHQTTPQDSYCKNKCNVDDYIDYSGVCSKELKCPCGCKKFLTKPNLLKDIFNKYAKSVQTRSGSIKFNKHEFRKYAGIGSPSSSSAASLCDSNCILSSKTHNRKKGKDQEICTKYTCDSCHTEESSSETNYSPRKKKSSKERSKTTSSGRNDERSHRKQKQEESDEVHMRKVRDAAQNTPQSSQYNVYPMQTLRSKNNCTATTWPQWNAADTSKLQPPLPSTPVVKAPSAELKELAMILELLSEFERLPEQTYEVLVAPYAMDSKNEVCNGKEKDHSSSNVEKTLSNLSSYGDLLESTLSKRANDTNKEYQIYVQLNGPQYVSSGKSTAAKTDKVIKHKKSSLETNNGSRSFHTLSKSEQRATSSGHDSLPNIGRSSSNNISTQSKRSSKHYQVESIPHINSHMLAMNFTFETSKESESFATKTRMRKLSVLSVTTPRIMQIRSSRRFEEHDFTSYLSATLNDKKMSQKFISVSNSQFPDVTKEGETISTKATVLTKQLCHKKPTSKTKNLRILHGSQMSIKNKSLNELTKVIDKKLSKHFEGLKNNIDDVANALCEKIFSPIDVHRLQQSQSSNHTEVNQGNSRISKSCKPHGQEFVILHCNKLLSPQQNLYQKTNKIQSNSSLSRHVKLSDSDLSYVIAEMLYDHLHAKPLQLSQTNNKSNLSVSPQKVSHQKLSNLTSQIPEIICNSLSKDGKGLKSGIAEVADVLSDYLSSIINVHEMNSSDHDQQNQNKQTSSKSKLLDNKFPSHEASSELFLNTTKLGSSSFIVGHKIRENVDSIFIPPRLDLPSVYKLNRKRNYTNFLNQTETSLESFLQTETSKLFDQHLQRYESDEEDLKRTQSSSPLSVFLPAKYLETLLASSVNNLTKIGNSDVNNQLDVSTEQPRLQNLPEPCSKVKSISVTKNKMKNTTNLKVRLTLPIKSSNQEKISFHTKIPEQRTQVIKAAISNTPAICSNYEKLPYRPPTSSKTQILTQQKTESHETSSELSFKSEENGNIISSSLEVSTTDYAFESVASNPELSQVPQMRKSDLSMSDSEIRTQRPRKRVNTWNFRLYLDE